MIEKVTRREFLQDTAVATAVLAAGLAMPAEAQAAPGPDFASQWLKTPDRVWLGAEYWANPLQDWRVAGGRIECGKPDA